MLDVLSICRKGIDVFAYVLVPVFKVDSWILRSRRMIGGSFVLTPHNKCYLHGRLIVTYQVFTMEKKGRFEIDDKVKEGAKKVGHEVKEGGKELKKDVEEAGSKLKGKFKK
ncbi:MAG: hypothetical protein LLG16_03220 [Euryarchaeota archaeon]|nr:hypothetical protein [Euryarchaeota archaeon]